MAVNNLGKANASAYLRVVSEIYEDPILQPLQGSQTFINVAIILALSFFISVGCMILMFKKYNRAKYMKHNHAMVNLWTKKVVVIKTVPPNDSNSVPNELVS